MQKKKAAVRQGPVTTGFGAKVEPYLWLIPMFFFLIMFTYYPFARTVIGSFFKVNAKNQLVSFCGLDNYVKAITDRNFTKSLTNTLKFVVMSVPTSLILSTLLALIADKKRRFHSIYMVLYSLPMAVSMSALCLIFKYFLNNQIGLFNYVFGLDIDWFNDKVYALPALAVLTIWLNIGFQFIYVTSALRNVPEELIEAAYIEGANALQRTTKIILPLISPTLFYLFCIAIVGDMMVFTQVNIITGGGPRNATRTLMYQMYTTGFTNQQWGPAYALSVIIFAITGVIMAISFAYEKKGVFYS